LLPRINFYTDVCKIILDTLRHNSKTLGIYNTVAISFFEFCKRFKCRKEFTRLCETLHYHYGQIIKQQKQPETIQHNKIPNPVKLNEEDSVVKLLELRAQQLKYALHMEVW
jgi:hypothetical protein